MHLAALQIHAVIAARHVGRGALGWRQLAGEVGRARQLSGATALEVAGEADLELLRFGAA